MKKHKIKIGLVSYLNTLPFVHGIKLMQAENSVWDIETVAAYPSECTRLFMENKIDTGIIPVGALPKINDYEIITDFCLGSNKQVDSVLLVSQEPIREIKTILLDYQSNTSVLMTKILARYFWHISPQWQQTTEGYENLIAGPTAGVVIGDRTFELKNKFPYCYDLANEWFRFKELPFVFALWIAKPGVPQEFIQDFNYFLSEGVKQIPEALKNFDLSKSPLSYKDALDYLTTKMDYRYTQKMKTAQAVFLSLANNL